MTTEIPHQTSFLDGLFSDPAFWVSVSFIGFLALFIRLALPAILRGLDGRCDAIRRELEEAQALREEAQATLAAYQKRQREVLSDAERILTQAKKEAEALRTAARARLDEEIQRRVDLANEKIARAEAQALQKVQSNIVDIAVMAAQELIIQRIEAQGDEELITLAIDDAHRLVH